MALQIIKPYIHVEDANGNPYVGAKLYIYQPETTTLASVFTDDDLTVAAANPATSDAAGNFPRLYIAAGTYKLRAQTSAGTLIWQEDNIDTGLSAGSGALPVSRGGTGATTAAAARVNLDVPSNSELAALSTSISTIASAVQNIVSIPQGYLTLTSGKPVVTSDVTAGTSVYYTPFIGNLVPIYDGSQFNTEAFSELTLTLNSNHVANAIYDLFLFKDNGVIILGTGPAWNTATAGSGARGSGAGTTELTRSIGGLHTNANSMTARNGATTYTVAANRGTYVGSLHMDGTNGQVSCTVTYGRNRKRGLWNAYSRRRLLLKAGDPTSTYTYGTNTYRPSGNSSDNKATVFCGLAEEVVTAKFLQQVNTDANTSTTIGIGWNSTTAASGLAVTYLFSASTGTIVYHAEYAHTVPFIGINDVQCLEKAAGTTTFNGTEAKMLLTTEYWG